MGIESATLFWQDFRIWTFEIQFYFKFQSQKKVQGEMDQVRAKCVDIERAERAVRVELEQMSKKVKKDKLSNATHLNGILK